MSRLKKIATADDEMSFDEIKEETLMALENMSRMTNEWAVRDILTKFTSFGFYRGQQMASINAAIAQDICKQTIQYVQGLTKYNEADLFEIYDKVYHYSR